MKKINLRGISEILGEKELKNVVGGSMYELMAVAGREDNCFSLL
jgi:bacteriocin-like protein